MPVADQDLESSTFTGNAATTLPFPPITKSHILNCSYHSWYPRLVVQITSQSYDDTNSRRYRSQTPKARIIALPPAFVSYLQADGIILPPEDNTSLSHDSNSDSWTDLKYGADDDSEDEESDPSLCWSETHAKIKACIEELGGSVMPKLNWSAPKDATWISATNSMDCRTANDIYLLLKSSDFITHDLEQAYTGCEETDSEESTDEESNANGRLQGSGDKNLRHSPRDTPFYLILRKTISAYNPSMEFRCFVRDRVLLCICQRDLNHFEFLPQMVPQLRKLIQEFFQKHLAGAFPDSNFVFDVYIPSPHTRVWLIDINPWAVRTDPLLFSWLEILEMPGIEARNDEKTRSIEIKYNERDGQISSTDDRDLDSDDSIDECDGRYAPEFRLINRNDPEAYSFNTPQYSAHKLPKDVVDAGVDGKDGLMEFIGRWREITQEQETEDAGSASADVNLIV